MVTQHSVRSLILGLDPLCSLGWVLFLSPSRSLRGHHYSIHDTQVHDGEGEDHEQHSSHQPVSAADCPRATTWLGHGSKAETSLVQRKVFLPSICRILTNDNAL